MAKILHAWDKKTIHKASWVIADTKAEAHYFSEEFGFPLERLIVLYLEADKSIYFPRIFQPDKEIYNVLYFGSILPVQGVDVVLAAMKLLAAEQAIHFTIIGPLSKDKAFNPKDFPNTSFYDWLPQEALAERIAAAHLTLAGHFSPTIGKADRTIAGKTFIYEVMQKPMILGDSRANRERFSPDEKHIYVPRGGSSKLAQTIKEQAKHYFELESV